MKYRLAAMLVLAASAAFAADAGFDRLVKAVETQFEVRHTNVPLMGLANFVLKVARPAGTSGMKLAIFEDLRIPDDADPYELDRMMERVSAGLRPIIRVYSRRDHELTYIYAGESGKTTKMLIATFSREDAVVVEMKVNLERLARMLNEPRLAGKVWSRNETNRIKEP